jgi:hypothetical protein
MSLADRARVNHELRKLGFGSLDDPNLIPQIAVCIRDHDHFRNQLFSVVPEKRKLAYEQLRPHLRFVAKPLDVYEAEMKQLAEKQRLPIWDGSAYPKPMPDAQLTQLAQDAIRQNAHEAKGHLELVCTKCTKQGIFRSKLRKDAEKTAQGDGWRWAERNGQMKTYCPEHVPGRLTMTLECAKCEKVETLRAWDEQSGYAAARLRGWAINDAATCPQCTVKQIIQ